LLPILQKLVGFRNRIVHEYERVEDDFVYGILTKNIGDFTLFGQAIRRYLDKKAKAGGAAASDEAAGRTLRERRAAYTARRKRKTAR
jgi:hypothetical protein